MTVKDKLIKELLKLPEAKYQSGNTEIVTLCPFCKDRHKTPKFYIEIDNDECMRVHCFHGDCQNPTGLMTPEVLHQLGIINNDFDNYVSSLNKKGVSKIKNTADITNDFIIPTRPKESDMKKISYSSNRTGIDFSKAENIKNYKMIYNLRDFVTINKINLGISDATLEDLTNHWIGFLSYNNNIINMRNVDSKRTDKRYVNIKINESNYSFLYLPAQEVDLMARAPKIVIAEGAYDIMCIKNRFFPKDAYNIIFGAVGSAASYNRGLMKMIQLSCFFDADIIIYGDQDIPLDFYYKKFAKILKNNKITVYRNKKNKDFGNINEEVSLDIKHLN